jgi:3-oxoacyl-[acyl-carrier-protein] synthase II
MQRSLTQSSLLPHQIDHINCHATSTAAGDDQEIKAIQGLFQNQTNKGKTSITANKGQIGHCFGAAGSIETIFMIQSMKNVLGYFIEEYCAVYLKFAE